MTFNPSGTISSLDHRRQIDDSDYSITIQAKADEVILFRFHDFFIGDLLTDVTSEERPIYERQNYSCEREFLRVRIIRI